jgi:hypothetical protein
VLALNGLGKVLKANMSTVLTLPGFDEKWNETCSIAARVVCCGRKSVAVAAAQLLTGFLQVGPTGTCTCIALMQHCASVMQPLAWQHAAVSARSKNFRHMYDCDQASILLLLAECVLCVTAAAAVTLPCNRATSQCMVQQQAVLQLQQLLALVCHGSGHLLLQMRLLLQCQCTTQECRCRWVWGTVGAKGLKLMCTRYKELKATLSA